jgi:hypothetical protein
VLRSGRIAAVALTALTLNACGGGAGGGGTAPAVSGSGGNPAPVPASFTLQNVKAAPYAVWADALGSQPVTIEARTQAAGHVALQLSYFDGLVGGSGAQIVRPMFDDGTHGDEVAGDGVWTLTFALGLAQPGQLRLYDGLVDSVSIAISAVNDARAPIPPANPIDARIDVSIINRSLEDEFPVRGADATTQFTDNMINLVDPSFDESAIERTIARVYQIVPGDPFDFAVLFHTRTTTDGVPRSIGVKNDVGGINVAAFDHTAAYGSAGRLQQIVFQNAHTLGLEINHEIGHRWAAYLNRAALNLSLPTGFHWGASDHVGVMGNGPYLQEDAGGYRVTNAADSDKFIANPFSNLELYLMGLARPDEVQPYRFVTDPSVNVQFDTVVPAASTRVVTIDDIIGVYGERAPAMAAAQNAFTAAFVVVSDRLLTKPEYTLTSLIARYASGTSPGGKRDGGLFEALDPPSFGAATGYRATLDTTLPTLGI